MSPIEAFKCVNFKKINGDFSLIIIITIQIMSCV